MEYFQKVRYIILVDSRWDEFLTFETVFLNRSATLSFVWKQHHKNERNLCLVAHIFIKLSHTVFLINIYILIYWHIRCDWKLWNVLWFYCVFWPPFLSVLLYLHQTFIVCIFYQYWYVKMSDVTASYGTLVEFIEFFRCFHTLLTTIHAWSVVSSPKFHRFYV